MVENSGACKHSGMEIYMKQNVYEKMAQMMMVMY